MKGFWSVNMNDMKRLAVVAFGLLTLIATAAPAGAQDYNEPGILEPVSSHLQDKDIRIPNTDQSIDGIEQSNIDGDVVVEEAIGATSILGHTIDQASSPNDDMRAALQDMADAAAARDQTALDAAAREMRDILLGTTKGRIYDGYGMLNYNRWTDSAIGPEHFPSDAVEGEYKMKVARDSGETYISPFDGAERKIWEVDINMLYYDGQIDSDTFLLKFPFPHDKDDLLHVNYRIYSLVVEDFSPTLVMLDRREAQDTVSFPFKGFDSVWIPMIPGKVYNFTVKYPPIRMIRGVYDWGWRVHPPRIQFLQPIYEIQNAWTGEIELDPQGKSFARRNATDLTFANIGEAAPEKKMHRVARATLLGYPMETIEAWLTQDGEGPRGRWFEWADLAKTQTQLPPEAWDMLAEEDGLSPGEYGDYRMLTAYMNNEMYGEGPFLNEVNTWQQGDSFEVKLFNLDNHTHYFRNVDFSARLHDDIARCCGGGDTSFEIMNFGPSFGAPKVAEMQWRAGWGFRPHHDVIQQQEVFPRGRDRMKLSPYRSGLGEFYFGYQYSEEARGGDFRFSPPPFVITNHADPAPFPLRDNDNVDGLLIGQRTPGYGVAQMCPQDPAGDFCTQDISQFSPNGNLNWPDPANPEVPKTELRFPAFLRNPAQGDPLAGDIIPPTDVWRPFLWINPSNGTLFIDENDPSKGYWADLTYSHGAPVYAQQSILAVVEMPRSSGQIFYQFDDLFHDNSIFSPHPVATGDPGKQIDSVRDVLAQNLGGDFGIAGRLARFAVNDDFSPWVSIYQGDAGAKGCNGTLRAVAPTDDNGRFRLRLPNINVPSGTTVCVQSIIGGFAETIVP